MRHISFREVDGSDYFHLCLIIKRGKSQLVIAIGCTGGQHRSVTLTEYLGKHLKPEYSVHVSHRDVEKRKGH